MKKLILIIILPLILMSCLLKPKKGKVKIGVTKIGISKVVAHPSLDLVEKGIKDVLKGKNILIEVKSANGELATADLIAKNFRMGGKTAVIGIGTLTSQSLKNINDTTPVLFSAVSSPEEANLIASNVTGTSDKLVCIDKQLRLLVKTFPNVSKIGVLYSNSELNSMSQVKEIEEQAKKLGLTIVRGGATNSSEIPQVVKTILEKVDALYIPTDNLMVSNVSYIIDAANSMKKPLIASEPSSVASGALFSYGVDYYDLGRKTGLILLKILNGKLPKDIPYVTANPKLYINKETEKLLNVSIQE